MNTLRSAPLIIIILLASSLSLYAQQGGVRGMISDEQGQPLSFATIYVRQLGTGTTANADGFYEIALSPGDYEIVFQHLGRKTEVRKIRATTGMVSLDISLEPQEIVLQSVTVSAGDEDPAYSIMRKAIAAASYHRNALDAYSATVYIKGAGKLKDYPWLAKKALEKEGIEKDRVYVSESVSEIRFTRPSKFEEKVISIRSDGKDNNTSPNGYIFGSFYQPEIAGTVSPLSPKAFSYYRFEYLGTFKDREFEVNRIRVTPRSKGEDVVDGMLFIVEGDWSIHSIDMHTVKMGVDVHMKVICDPVEDKAWLPVSHQYKVDGKVFGFAFEYNYLATVSKYRITVNPEMFVDRMEVIDGKKEEGAPSRVEGERQKKAKNREAGKTTALQERLAKGEEITRKELKTIVREYEKQERKQQAAPEVLSDVTFKVDSAAFRKDSLYWAEVRPIPLTREEIRGYEKTDSVSKLETAKFEGDTTRRSRHKGFQPWDLIIGDDYPIGRHSNFRIEFPMPAFNTVEGFTITYRVALGRVLQDTNRTRLTLKPVMRYAFSRGKLSGYLNASLRNDRLRLDVDAGRYISQYNADNPILPVVNTLTTLLLERNLMKIYERDFVDVRFRKDPNPFVTIRSDWSWSHRRELFNTSDFKLVDRDDIEGYSANAPVHAAGQDTSFPSHQALTASVGFTTRPWLKFRVYNGQRRPVRSSSPALSLDYRKGFGKALGSDVDFDQLEIGVRHELRLWARGNIIFWLRGGAFLRDQPEYFVDFKHFLGNRTPLVTTDPVGSFRLLDYYRYSTRDRYFTANVHYQFRKLVVTTIPVVRLAGIRENLFVNYLATPDSQHYTEIGYSIDSILRMLRVEVVAAIRDGRYDGFGVRIGIATALTQNLSD